MRASILLAVLLTACGDTGTTPADGPGSDCALSVDSLGGHTFVELEIQGDKSEKPNPQARLRFAQDGGTTTAKYTVKNALNVYDYTCSPSGREGELKCVTEPHWDRACLALEVNKEGSCSEEALTKAGLEGDADARAKGIEKARKSYAAAKKQEADIRKSDGDAAADRAWKTFVITNNNVANTLQGVIYVKVDKDRCRLQLDDMMKTLFNGEPTEDFNPVGSNPFVSTDQEYLFENCLTDRHLADLDTAELPKLSDIPPVREHKAGQPVHYHYVGPNELKGADGCTYSADLWANWTPVEKGKAIDVADDGTIQWHVTHTWAAADRIFIGNDLKTRTAMQGGFLHLTRHKTCGGKSEIIDTVCNSARVVE